MDSQQILLPGAGRLLKTASIPFRFHVMEEFEAQFSQSRQSRDAPFIEKKQFSDALPP